eukprot:Transcript_14849.p1 GENE.Transcript_14849~~Transcript_14849.p1  ORF type:complete len:475 (+),score=119.95 Transcript_14849:204-1427(+)
MDAEVCAIVQRVSAWLLASPWELRKCRSLKAALAATAQVCGCGAARPKPAEPTAPPPAVVSRDLPAVRPLLCCEQGQGLRLVRLAALAALSAEERRWTTVRLRLDGHLLHVQVAVAAGGGGSDASDRAAVEAAARAAADRALDAAALAAAPLAVRAPLPQGLSAGQLIGRGGRGGVHALQRTLESAVKVAVAAQPTEVTWPGVAPRRDTRRRGGGGGGGGGRGAGSQLGVVVVRVGPGWVEAQALARLAHPAARAALRAQLVQLLHEGVRDAARGVDASRARAEEGFAQTLARAEEGFAQTLARARRVCHVLDPSEAKERREHKRWRDARDRAAAGRRRQQRLAPKCRAAAAAPKNSAAAAAAAAGKAPRVETSMRRRPACARGARRRLAMELGDAAVAVAGACVAP